MMEQIFIDSISTFSGEKSFVSDKTLLSFLNDIANNSNIVVIRDIMKK